MTPDEHAAEAVRLSEVADGLDGLRYGTPEYAIVTALGSLTHAVLALRPAQPEAPVQSDPTICPLGEDGTPAQVGTVIRARVDDEIGAYVRVEPSRLGWMQLGTSTGWEYGSSFTEVEVLFPGVPS